MMDFYPGGAFEVPLCVVKMQYPGVVLVTSFADVPPSLGARGARLVALGERARAAGDSCLANIIFCFAAGAVVTGEREGNPAAELNRARECVELGGGSVNAGLNALSLSAGVYWATHAARGGHADAPALLEWITKELARWPAVGV